MFFQANTSQNAEQFCSGLKFSSTTNDFQLNHSWLFFCQVLWYSPAQADILFIDGLERYTFKIAATFPMWPMNLANLKKNDQWK